ncbi:glycosyltransferase [Flavobacterium sediminilitoris]|uniref:Glycosyltransferase n=1 Tax=Flavobacterium sediminilitoris TaxID=2024526 RepID=A0ABY4HN70_9FLAO|nr:MULTISPECIES: glycosyltransferase family 2 protein [Flavobacterium]UOX34028.1 glycosyltransferase [Flavobacterium sediminilitoris]
MQQLVSIIIPTYNSSIYLKQTLDSVLRQTYTNWECILVDDGSTDLTETITENYREKDTRFHLYKRPENLPKGPSSARNYGVTKANGEYLIFLDADDLLANTCLENRVEQFNKNQDCDFLVFQMERFVNEPDYSNKEKKVEENKEEILNSFIKLHGQWPISSPIYKTNFFSEKIKFNSNLIVFEDLEVAIKSILLASNFLVFKLIDCYYRNDENYDKKYNSLEVKIRMINSFQEFIIAISKLVNSNDEKQFKNADIKLSLIKSYKKIFLFYIIENSKIFKGANKKILQLLITNNLLSSSERIKFSLVNTTLLPFANLKGSGISRLIKYLYK